MALEPQIYRIASWEKYRLSRQTVNKHRKDSLLWIPLYVDSWLFGSVRFELEPDEQATFVDLLALAAKDNGFIRANETMPYPLNSLSGMFNKSVELLERTIIKCLDPKINKLEIVDLQDCQYPLQDYQGGSEKPIARVEKNREEKNRKENITDSKESVSRGFNSRNPLFLEAKEIAIMFWNEHKCTLGVAPKQPFLYKEGSKSQEKCIVHGAFLALGEWDGDEFRERYTKEQLISWIPVFFADNSPDTVNRCRRIGGRTWAAFMDWVSIEANGGVKK